MKIEVNISKTYLFIIVGAILVLAGSVYVYAGVNEALPWHSADQVKLASGNSVEEDITEIWNVVNAPDEFSPGTFIVARAENESYFGNAQKLMKTFYMGLGGSAIFNATITSCRTNKDLTIFYKINDVEVGTPCTSRVKTICSETFEFEEGDKIELFMQGTKYCGSTLRDVVVGVENSFKVDVIN